ncbi:tRNA preQ1(34) S-adenosylmethionine ribosyltransferase-isomerase QueA [Rickettsia prowazekii]|uniref:S-adenosylmethionine:tRNA ribosyltransferase-isomerase n=2 Tax=Rickettsia prowazekii TaxID=782 RepID=QUEA_RICPR|nr:tRNA preQ1(34) S-adenosylmethionine ribosyltransferase-isomerase QueA [Rickettsia prowazekii]Q9ZDV6.1 RecName: Full=S-adenosylmethionine:tRNA ribosyltransferase-isomerase; AltName: Full=Queuosine biosynthesis protein QueA [Rickettsia prowazekii str. Madrid E]EOB10736.1 ATPase N2B [Rickettsia prowazekii str. GvF12]ADE29723.1 S-adenosylmethionine:tRNAribosyltransferase-isomerase [Rickettsia prowazekii str. Rp22]AFE49033.1 S-adenosylmethionine:tRNA ribosyltransferase-isomerase [Rickettsia prowa
MKLSDFDFNLPSALIAQYPSSERDNSDLLIAGTKHIKTKFYNIIDYLKKGDLLVFNNSKVIKAKLHLGKNITINLNKKLSDNCWIAFAKPARKLNIGDEFYFDTHKIIITEKLAIGEIKVKFMLDNISIIKFLDKYGEIPLPFYIKRPSPVCYSNMALCCKPENTLKIKSIPHNMSKIVTNNSNTVNLRSNDGIIDSTNDNDRYQTIYSQIEGSVAAPTAGLHFTKNILDKLKTKGVHTAFVTLHVGAGTFLPVKTENIHEHKMHTEYCSITTETAEIINKTKQEGRSIIAVGTTTLRTIESACNNGIVRAGNFETDIFITPGFNFQVVDMLLTNFHFPKSTLFILICAFAGFKEMHALYKYAIKEKMRFFSYGDATLLYRKV